MEKGDNRRSRYGISENKSLLSDDYSGLMKLHSSTEGFPCRGSDGGGGAGGGGWPTGSNRGGANEVVGCMYYNSVSSSCLGAENFSTSNSQPFDIFAAPYSYESPAFAGRTMAAASVAFPFTSAQWRELERQAMIYKYMVSSLPVPPDLLFPLSRNLPPSVSSMYNVRYSKDGDPEPGRCKRTDGKKWRCSRDVAPHQKYCERHLHRGRPRSRKPVEPVNNSDKKAPIDQTNLQEQHLAAAAAAAPNDKPLLHFDLKTDLNISNTPCDRDLGLMDGAEKQWQLFTQTNMGSANEGRPIYGSDSPFHQDYVEQNLMNVSSYSKFPAFEVPAYFTDAYSSNSNGTVHSSISTKPENLPPSLNLSISMASGTSSDQEMAKVNCCDEQSMKDSRWLSPVSWEPSGGPLAEALGCKNPASAHTSISTTVSSPTGVLHGTLFSHSAGSSVCNSPTSEVAFRWLN